MKETNRINMKTKTEKPKENTEWKRTSESFRGRRGEAIIKNGSKSMSLDFIPCTESLPPVGLMVLVAIASNSTKRFKVALAVRTGLQFFDSDEGRWRVFEDSEDGFGKWGIMAWHPLPSAKVSTCPDYK